VRVSPAFFLGKRNLKFQLWKAVHACAKTKIAKPEMQASACCENQPGMNGANPAAPGFSGKPSRPEGTTQVMGTANPHDRADADDKPHVFVSWVSGNALSSKPPWEY